MISLSSKGQSGQSVQAGQSGQSSQSGLSGQSGQSDQSGQLDIYWGLGNLLYQKKSITDLTLNKNIVHIQNTRKNVNQSGKKLLEVEKYPAPKTCPAPPLKYLNGPKTTKS